MIINHTQSPVSEGAEQREATLNAHKTELSDLLSRIKDAKLELESITDNINSENVKYAHNSATSLSLSEEISHKNKELSLIISHVQLAESELTSKKSSLEFDIKTLLTTKNDLELSIKKLQEIYNIDKENQRREMSAHTSKISLHQDDIKEQQSRLEVLKIQLEELTAEIIKKGYSSDELSLQLSNLSNVLLSRKLELENLYEENNKVNEELIKNRAESERNKVELDFIEKEKERVMSETAARLSYFSSCEFNFEKRERSIKALEEELNLKHQKFLKQHVSNNN